MEEKRKYIQNSGMVLSEKDKLTMIDAVMSGEVCGGKYVKMAEDKLGKYLGLSYVSLCNSGSSANLLAFMAFTSPQMHEKWRLKKGDKIITLAASFPTTIAPIVQAGCVPIFLDINNHLGINIAQLKEVLETNNDVKGMFFAHTLGIPCNIDEVKKLCDKYDLFWIEDNCDALGSKYKGKFTGTFGEVSTYSFYPAHHITAGEGGAVVTNDPLIDKIIRSLRDWGRDCVCLPGQDNKCGHRFDYEYKTGLEGQLPKGFDHKFTYSHLGYNLKMTNPSAALLYSQLDRLDEFIEIRKRNFWLLYEKLSIYSLFDWNDIFFDTCDSSFFGYPILLPDYIDRQKVIKELDKNGVGTRLLFAGNILAQECSYQIDDCITKNLSMTNKVMCQLFWIGLWQGLTEDDINYEAEIVLQAIQNKENLK